MFHVRALVYNSKNFYSDSRKGAHKRASFILPNSHEFQKTELPKFRFAIL